MVMNEILFTVVVAMVVLVGGLVLRYLIPFLKGIATEEQTNRVMFWVESCVVVAEKKYEEREDMGQTKKEFVTQFIIKHFKLDKIMSMEQLSVIIDAVVELTVNAPDDDCNDDKISELMKLEIK